MQAKDIVQSLLRQAGFALAMTQRDLRGLYRGSVLGIGWLFLRPLIHAAAYVLIVLFVFRMPAADAMGPYGYVLHVFAGLTAWQPMQRNFEEAPSLVRERMDVLRQMVYPIETLPISSLIVSFIPATMTLLVYTVLSAKVGTISWTMALLPLPVAMLAVLMIGTSWLFMVVGTVIRDLRDVVAVAMGILVFFSPVILTKEMAGERLWQLVLLNPLSHVVICFRDVLQGSWHPASWMTFAVLACTIFCLGAWLLARVKLVLYELM